MIKEPSWRAKVMYIAFAFALVFGLASAVITTASTEVSAEEINPDFNGTPRICSGPPCWVTFTNLTVGGKLPYQNATWDFGDGNIEVGAVNYGDTITHRYLSVGVFSVRLTLTDGNGFEVYQIEFDYITVVPVSLVATLACEVDMVVTDPDGLMVGKNINQITGASYTEVDLNGDGDPDPQIIISDRKQGDYFISVFPKPNANPTSTYSLYLSAGGSTLLLADNQPVSDIPEQGYVVRSTETEIIQIVPATIDFDPNTLNLKSKGKFVTTYIELPTGCDVGEIDITTIELNGAVTALAKPTEVGDHDEDGIPDLMVKFDGAAVQGMLDVGDDVEITVTGVVDGIDFEGSDYIRVLD